LAISLLPIDSKINRKNFRTFNSRKEKRVRRRRSKKDPSIKEKDDG